ncbi:hypothetical protein Pint_35338 [Pistacia integerrima]|uniref:Uncharacterized protein n=1 Tax=Pistacia integerrima TaxID=434235 RepID=A0ACC0Y169_9ROSI|nr:hypothetical protein Pint_35338 [Pistacia integerrima]
MDAILKELAQDIDAICVILICMNTVPPAPWLSPLSCIHNTNSTSLSALQKTLSRTHLVSAMCVAKTSEPSSIVATTVSLTCIQYAPSSSATAPRVTPDHLLTLQPSSPGLCMVCKKRVQFLALQVWDLLF